MSATANATKGTEWVAELEHSTYGASKYVYLNPASLAEDLAVKTASGFIVRQVFQRGREKFNERDYPELYQ